MCGKVWLLAPYMSPRKPGGMTDPWPTLGNVARGRFVTSVKDDFVVYTWAMGHASQLARMAQHKTDNVHRFHCWGLEFWLLRLIDSRMCLYDQLPTNTWDSETHVGFPGQRPSTQDPVVLCQRKSTSDGLRCGGTAGEPGLGCSALQRCIPFPAAFALRPLLL